MKHVIHAIIGASVFCTVVQAQVPVLTYNGTSGGDWFAANVWLNELGQAVSWADDSIAVITNRNIALTAPATVYGFRVSFNTKYTINGAGRLTLGEGGIFTDTSGEFNIQCAGGLHLAASQAWVSANGGTMFCLDGRLPLSSENGVVLTISRGVFRTNGGGGLTPQCTVILLGANGRLSPSPDPAALGQNRLILEGPVTNQFAGDNSAFIGEPSTGSDLLLNNGASFQLAVNKQFRLPLLTVTSPKGTVASAISGAELSLTNAETALLIQSGASLNISAKLTNGPAGASAVRKTGSGTLQFSGAQAFSGGLLVDAGRVAVSAADGLGAGGVTLASGTTLELMPNAAAANVITGAGAVTKTGAGSATLTGASTYTGGTTVLGGTVRVNALGAFGTGAVALNGNTVAFINSITLSPVAALAKIPDAGTLRAENNTTLTWTGDYPAAQSLRLAADLLGTVVIEGALTGSGLAKTDAGKLVVTNTVGYTGEIVVDNGILFIGSTSILEAGVTVRTTGSGSVQLDTLAGQNLAKITGTQNITFGNGSAIPFDTDTTSFTPSVAANETLVISNLSGSGDLIKIGLGTMVVTNAPNFTGRVFVLDGTLVAEAALGSQAVMVSNGTLRVNNATLSNPITIAEATAVLAVTNSGSLGSGPVLAVNVGRLRVETGGSIGARAVTLSGAGVVQVADGAGFDNGTLTVSGGTLEFIASTVMGKAPVVAANCTFRTSAATIAAEISGFVSTTAKAKLVVGGGGRITFSGGANIVSGGEIFVQNTGTEFLVVSNKVTISGYAGLEGGGKLFLVKDGGEVELTGGTGVSLHISTSGTSTFEVGEGGTLNIPNGANVRLGYNAGSTGILRINGGTARFSNNGVFDLGMVSGATGRVELVSGTLQTSRQLRTSGSGTLVFNGGTLRSDGVNNPNPWVTTGIPITVERGGGTIDVNGLEMVIGGSAVRGLGTLTVTGNGTAHFNRPSPDWTGGVTADTCTLCAGATNALGGAGTVNLSNNTLRVTANATLPNVIQTSDASISVGAGLTARTGIAMGGKITKTGAGHWIADALFEDVDLSIQQGPVTVEPATATLAAVQSLAGNPAFWVDATATASLTLSGNNVSRWYDRRTPNDANGFYAYTQTPNYNPPVWTLNALNEQPVVDFGTLGQTGLQNQNRMMMFKSYISDIRTVFWVIGSRNGGGFLLGDNVSNNGARHFHRAPGTANLYGGLPADPLWGGSDKGIVRNGETWVNMQPVNGSATGLSGGFDLVTWRISASDHLANNAAGAIWFASCYAPTDGRLNGGQELGEVLIYTNRLTDTERRLTEFYLARKWFPAMVTPFPVKSISLDGDGAAFHSGYGVPLQIAELIINASDTSVGGTPVSVAKLTVTGNGTLHCERLQTLAVSALELLSGAAIAVNTDTHAALLIADTVTLPNDTAAFSVTGTAKPPTSLLLIRAQGTVTGGPPQWVAAPGTPGAARIQVNTISGEVWLKAPSGTLILLR